jgi:hypothetical protein
MDSASAYNHRTYYEVLVSTDDDGEGETDGILYLDAEFEAEAESDVRDDERMERYPASISMSVSAPDGFHEPIYNDPEPEIPLPNTARDKSQLSVVEICSVVCAMLICVPLDGIWWILKSVKNLGGILRWRVIPPRNLFGKGDGATTATGGLVVVSMTAQFGILCFLGAAIYMSRLYNSEVDAMMALWLIPGFASTIWGILTFSYGAFLLPWAYAATTAYYLLEIVKIGGDVVLIYRMLILGMGFSIVEVYIPLLSLSVLLSVANLSTLYERCGRDLESVSDPPPAAPPPPADEVAVPMPMESVSVSGANPVRKSRSKVKSATGLASRMRPQKRAKEKRQMAPAAIPIPIPIPSPSPPPQIPAVGMFRQETTGGGGRRYGPVSFVDPPPNPVPNPKSVSPPKPKEKSVPGTGSRNEDAESAMRMKEVMEYLNGKRK